MKTVQFIFLLALVSAPAWGSNAKVDSLKQLLEHHATIDKAEVLWGIAYELFDVDNGQALFYAERAYHEVWKRGDSLQIVKVGTTYGQLLRRMGKVDRSIEVSSTMLPIAKRHEYRKYWKMLLNSLGLAYAYKMDYVNGLDLAYQSLFLREAEGDSLEIAIALLNIGYINLSLRELDNAEGVTRRANAVFARHSKGAEHLIIGLLNLGNIESFRGKLVPAVDFHKAALKLAEQSGIRVQVPQIYQSLAHCYLSAGKYDSARYASQIAIDLAKKSTNIWALFSGYHALMKSALATGDPELAKLCLEKADSISLSVDFTQMPSALVIPRIQVLLANREYNEAARLLNAYSLEWESLEFAKNYDKIRQRQISFAQRDNEAKLKLQSSIMQLQKENLNRQQMFILVVSVLLILLLVLSLALYRANKRKQEVNQMLDRIVEERTRELSRHRDALQHLIDEENGRRGRVGNELMSLLASLKGLLHLAKVDRGVSVDDYMEKALALTGQAEHISQKYNEHASRKPQI